MANIPLKSIKFPGLDDTYVIEPEMSDVQGLEDALNNKANIDGTYDDMTVGNAKQLLSDMYVEDKEPFTFRTTGGSNNIGDRADMELVGWTGAWNQLAKLVSTSGSGITITEVTDGVTISGTATSGCYFSFFSGGTQSTHKYFLGGGKSESDTTSHWLYAKGLDTNYYRLIGGKTATIVQGVDSVTLAVANGTEISTPIKYQPQLIDLTAMFGSTIADYIYTLETNQAGDGVAFFKKYFEKPYYAYCQPKLESVCVSAYGNNGFNQWDEELESGGLYTSTGLPFVDADYLRAKNFIRILPNTTYWYKAPSATQYARLYFYDADKNFISYSGTSGSLNNTFTTPQNACYMKFVLTVGTYGTTYKNDICINLHWDGERDGEYEAYDQRNYPLDTVTLLGKLKLDANNVPYADGDTYSADGTVIRRYGIRAYQAGDESLADAITDGTNTVYKLITPTTESADPYTTPQIVDDWGTEWYTDYEVAQGNRDVAIPAGHNTKYLENLKADVEMMPKSPNGDGDYVMRQTSGQNAYVSLASTQTITDIINRLEALENA